MLLHEWLQYRDKRIKRLRSQMDEQDEAAEQEQRGEAEGKPEALSVAEGPAGQSAPGAEGAVDSVAEVRGDVTAAQKAAAEKEAAAEGVEAVEAGEGGSQARPKEKKRPRAPRSAREVLETLQPSQDLRARLEAVLARQRRLPLEEVEDEPRRRSTRRVVETREQLVERLLDPTLTLQEAALLLGVCPTTVRRYTNRGILKCFRTPGNQRRFKLSDILEFMERREREAQEDTEQ